MDEPPSQVKADTSSPLSGDVALQPLVLPDLPAVADAAMLARSSGRPSPCDSVTSRAIEELISRAANASRKAEENKAKNAGSETGGAATAAALHAAGARKALEDLLLFLTEHKMIGQSGVVTTPAGTGAASEAARVALTNLLLARHFAAVSAINAKLANRDPSSAIEFISLAEQMFHPSETLSTEALHCYLRASFPVD